MHAPPLFSHPESASAPAPVSKNKPGAVFTLPHLVCSASPRRIHFVLRKPTSPHRRNLSPRAAASNVLPNPVAGHLLPLDLLPRHRQLPPEPLESPLAQICKAAVQLF